MYDHAIVAGKFWPLHLGHANLINAALEKSKRVTVFVVDSGETIDGDIRAGWVRKAFPAANVRKVFNLCLDDSTHDSNVKWAQYTTDLLDGDVPDVVFSSEQYAIGWADALGAKHVAVDPNRLRFHVSGTAIRNDPYGHFHLIHEIARPYYTKKVLVIGPESTGKTTLATKLALDYQTFATPEYGRMFVERYGITDYTKEAIFPHILSEQPRLEDELILKANRVLFCDTDLYTTYLWHQVWQPTQNDRIRDLIWLEANKRAIEYDLVLLMGPEGTEWVQDGYRDQKHTRDWFTAELENYYDCGDHSFKMLTGSWAKRERDAKDAVNALFGKTSAILP